MDTAKRYHDSEGNECSIHQMVKREPYWAAARIQEGEKAIAALPALLEKAERLERERDEAHRLLDEYGKLRGSLFEKDALCDQIEAAEARAEEAKKKAEKLERERDEIRAERNDCLELATKNRMRYEKAERQRDEARREAFREATELFAGVWKKRYGNVVNYAERKEELGMMQDVIGAFRAACPETYQHDCDGTHVDDECMLRNCKNAEHGCVIKEPACQEKGGEG